MKQTFKKFKKNLASIPERVEQTSRGKFSLLLIFLFFLPGGSILCLFALYLKFKNTFK
tara:strand:+ start:1303 stop:1476 length:174 start_codon:yes stop_codon:yes gene_type:complete